MTYNEIFNIDIEAVRKEKEKVQHEAKIERAATLVLYGSY